VSRRSCSVPLRVVVHGHTPEDMSGLSGGRTVWWLRHERGFADLLGSEDDRSSALDLVVLDAPACRPGDVTLGVGRTTRYRFPVPPCGGTVEVDAGTGRVLAWDGAVVLHSVDPDGAAVLHGSAS
jgi:hypothetical protein